MKEAANRGGLNGKSKANIRCQLLTELVGQKRPASESAPNNNRGPLNGKKALGA
jgi:hypothetical protein